MHLWCQSQQFWTSQTFQPKGNRTPQTSLCGQSNNQENTGLHWHAEHSRTERPVSYRRKTTRRSLLLILERWQEPHLGFHNILQFGSLKHQLILERPWRSCCWTRKIKIQEVLQPDEQLLLHPHRFWNLRCMGSPILELSHWPWKRAHCSHRREKIKVFPLPKTRNLYPERECCISP